MLRKYSTVERYLWRDPEFRALGHLEKLLWLHLLTSPLSTTLPGLIPTSLLILADEMGEDPANFKSLRKAFGTLEQLGWVRADHAARLVLLPGALRHNLPESPNVVLGWARGFDEIPESPLKWRWLESLRQVIEENPGKDRSRAEARRKGFTRHLDSLAKGLPEPFAIPTPIPDPTPDPTPDPDPEDLAPSAAASSPLELFSEEESEDTTDEPPADFTARQEDAFWALREETFRVVRWIQPKGTVRAILGKRAADELARTLGGEAFPAVAPRLTIAQAAAWIAGQPSRAKTPAGLGRFLTGWFAREQNRGGNLAAVPAKATPRQVDTWADPRYDLEARLVAQGIIPSASKEKARG